MADVHNDKHINQLVETFSTGIKGRYSFIISAVFLINILIYRYSVGHYFQKIRRNALLSNRERGIISACQEILFLHISKSKPVVALTAHCRSHQALSVILIALFLCKPRVGSLLLHATFLC